MITVLFTRSEPNGSQPVHLIPNTGRHFLFFELKKLDEWPQSLSDDDSRETPAELHERLVSIVEQNSDSWKTDANYPWLQYRLTTNWNDCEGVIAAVSTDEPSFANSDESRTAIRAIEIELKTDDGQPYGRLEFNIRSDECGTEEVDLFVDFGNTRLMALVSCESKIDDDEALGIHPVHFAPEFWPYDDWINSKDKLADYRVADSSLLLREPQFPESCSPAVVGGADSTFGQQAGVGRIVELNANELLFLSSPKRYAWDTRPINWVMLSKDLGNEATHPIEGLFEDLFLVDEHPTRLEKRHAIVFMALEILEATYRQLHSCWKRDWLGENIRKSIKNVFVTFPSSWTQFERDSFKNCWTIAGQIFASKRNNTQPPEITMTLDEATAAQIPFAFCSRRTMGIKHWISLYGRESGLRVLNVDIGGGTTDITVMHYQLSETSVFDDLKPIRRHKSSQTLAGDSFVEYMIKHVLIDELFEKATVTMVDQHRQSRIEKAKTYLRNNPKDLLKLTNCVLIPIVYLWLNESRNSGYQSQIEISLGELSTNQAGILRGFLKILEGQTEDGEDVGRTVDLSEIKLVITTGQVEQRVKQGFGALANQVARLTSHWDCDLVFLSGKPSEIPGLQRLFKSKIPLTESRVVFADRFDFGKWYPKHSQDRVDPKSLVVVGAALYHYELFLLEDRDDELPYRWFIRQRGNQNSDKNDVELEFENGVIRPIGNVPLKSTIFRQLNGSPHKEMVYKIESEPNPQPGQSRTRRVTLHLENIDSELRLVKGGETTPGTSLRVVTIPKEVFWKDAPDFF